MKIPSALETDRLVIRPFNKTDIEPFLEFMLDKIATEYLNFDKEHKTPKGAQQLFKFVLDSYKDSKPVFALAIVLKESNEFIGSCGLAPLNKNNSVECYYSLLPKYWNNGFATEAMNKLFEYSFDELEIHEICAYTSVANVRGSRVAERLGMKYNGITKYKETGLNGRLYTFTREDYFSRQSHLSGDK